MRGSCAEMREDLSKPAASDKMGDIQENRRAANWSGACPETQDMAPLRVDRPRSLASAMGSFQHLMVLVIACFALIGRCIIASTRMQSCLEDNWIRDEDLRTGWIYGRLALLPNRLPELSSTFHSVVKRGLHAPTRSNLAGPNASDKCTAYQSLTAKRCCSPLQEDSCHDLDLRLE